MCAYEYGDHLATEALVRSSNIDHVHISHDTEAHLTIYELRTKLLYLNFMTIRTTCTAVPDAVAISK